MVRLCFRDFKNLTLDLDIFEFVGGSIRLGDDDVGVVLKLEDKYGNQEG